ncbi:MAG: tRNA pseudouridine(38-40) synthase TruA [Bacillota bacterium]
MQNIRLEITYDGTAYSGFQIQENAPTIQGELERALVTIYKQKVRLIGAGRTDAGVHARGQAAHFIAPFTVPLERLPAALNSLLGSDIVVTDAAAVSPDFHARHDAKRKLYSYTLDRALYPRVMLRRFSLHYPEPLDLERIVEAASLLEGKHDFRAFQAAGSAVRDTVRTLHRVELRNLQDEQLLKLFFEGDGFLYRMVRLLTGSLLRVGAGKLDRADLAAALRGQNRAAAGPTAPPHGLCLERVVY